MADYGVTPQGFVVKPYTQIVIDLNAAMEVSFGADLDTAVDTPNGQLIGNIAAPIAEIWEQLNAVYDAFNPNAAFGISLRNVGVLNYLPEQSPSASTVDVVLTGTPGFVIPAAIAQISTTGIPYAFHFLADVTFPISGTITVEAEANEVGAITAPAGTITIISTPMTGWFTVNNPADAIPGRNDETDPEYRLRRSDSTVSAAQNVEDALLAALEALPGVLDAVVLSNNSDDTDGNGFLPNSIAVVVEGGEDPQIAQTIYNRKTSSIPTNGTITENIPNNAGILIPVHFYRPIQKPVYIRIEVLEYTGFPVDGLSQIQQNVYDYLIGTNNGGVPVFQLGDTVIVSKLYTPINLTQGVSVQNIFLGFTFPPTSRIDLPITFEQIATFDMDNIQVIGL